MAESSSNEPRSGASTFSVAELAELERAALVVAREAAALLKRGYRSRPAVTEKSQSDLVTEFDRASEEHLRRRLGELAPHIPFVGEEGEGVSASERASDDPVWFVDPLDGTTNFVHGHPFFCVAVGLLDAAGPAVGAVVAPVLDTTWSAHRGGAALRSGEPCRVSDTSSLAAALVATGFPPVRDRAPDNNFDSFMRVKRKAQAVRRCGSAAIDICFVGDGTYDGYWERRLHAWDAVAAAAVVLAAGGRITSLDGGPPDYHRGHIIVSNGLVHEALGRAVRGG